MHRLLLVLSLLGLACGDGDSLAVRGDVQFTAPGGAEAGGFDFPTTRDLVHDSVADGSTERFAGHCTVQTDAAGNDRVSVALERPSAQAVAFQPRRIQLVLPIAAGEGSVEVDLGGNVFSATVAGTCNASLDYYIPGDDRDNGLAGTTFDCVLNGPEGEARAVGELHFEGCE